MSRELLLHLNGNKNGSFRKWLDAFDGEPRIAWYPSAGQDFRDLLYLNRAFSSRFPATGVEPPPPDIFLHTDYFPWSDSTFLDSREIHVDDRTRLFLRSMEELPRCDLPLDPKIVDFPEGSHATGRVLFMDIQVHSSVLGSFSVPVLYAFAENGVFCAKKILAKHGRISHVVHVRFGGSLGGGKASGVWLLNVLRQLHCECLVTDNHYYNQPGDRRTCEAYPELSGKDEAVEFDTVRVVPSAAWSCHGDVSWDVVRATRTGARSLGMAAAGAE